MLGKPENQPKIAMKKLFEFTLSKTAKETVKETSKNEKGESVVTETEVEKTKMQQVFLRKPNRSLYDEAELFYGVKLSEGIKAGLLTRALLAKRFSNDGGVLSEDEKGRYADLYLKLYESQLDIDRLNGLAGGEKTDKSSETLDSLMRESADIRRELTDFEMAQSSLFEQTAENRARNKTILWWMLSLSYLEDEDGKSEIVFSGDSFEEKLDAYDELEDSDEEFDVELLRKLVYYVSFWYVGKINTQEEFEKLVSENAGIEQAVGEAVHKEMIEEELKGEEETQEEESDAKADTKDKSPQKEGKKAEKKTEAKGDAGGGDPKEQS